MSLQDHPRILAWLLCATVPLLVMAPAAIRADTGDTPQSKAFLGYYRCLTGMIDTLDDRRSDASTIASAATTMCDAEWEQMLAAFEAPMAPEKARAFRAAWTSKRQSLAVGYVLKGRSLRR